MLIKPVNIPVKHTKRAILYTSLLLVGSGLVFSIAVFDFLQLGFDSAAPTPLLSATTSSQSVEPFPVGVFPQTKEITEQPNVDDFLKTELLATSRRAPRNNWFSKLIAKITNKGWYQNLASPVSRVVVIFPGERKEEIIKNISSILRWDKDEKLEFESLLTKKFKPLQEGMFFPGYYVFTVGATPEEVSTVINQRFVEEVLLRYDDSIASVVPLKDALIIASLLEREAYDFTDMREISGVIWNRLFIDMKLQIDATLQYARGSQAASPSWWPVPTPNDKYIDSPYNTYQNQGLPPGPISNPSVDSVLAALNPTETTCLFYFHDRKSRFHCSETYEDHVALLKQYYGRGK